MKIFLDIGSHIGQTLHEVTKEKYAFDKIVCFEPSSFCLDQLKKFAEEDDRIIICEFGLGNRNHEVELFMPGTLLLTKKFLVFVLQDQLIIILIFVHYYSYPNLLFVKHLLCQLLP